jgi:hypothetical protein
LEANALIFALIVLVFMPIADVLSSFCGTIICQSATDYIASEAAKGASFSATLTKMTQASKAYTSMLPMQLLKAAPQGGLLASGANVYVQETNIYTGQVKLYNANSLPPRINAAENFYEFYIKTAFSIQPMFPISFLAQTPGFGKPLELSFSALEPVENVNQVLTPPVAAAPPMKGLHGLGGKSSEWLGDVALHNWNYPVNRYLVAGENLKSLQITYVTIKAINEDWTDTGVSVTAGDTIDFSSSPKLWQWAPGKEAYAQGVDLGSENPNGFREAALLMKIGKDGTPFYAPNSENCTVPFTGRIYLKCNDFYYPDNAFEQIFAIGTRQ